MEIKNEKFVFTKTLILKLRALILPLILPNSGTWQWVAQQLVIFYAAKKSVCLVADNDTDSETSECESDNEKEHVSS